MAFSDVFNTEVVNNKTENNESSFVAPEAGSGETLVVAGFVEAFSK